MSAPERIRLQEGELAKLMRLSGKNGAVEIDFGTAGVALAIDTNGRIKSRWALPLLTEWRGVSVSDGAGI